ncbi:MAG: peptidoglycan DD-metalloendopeptidase family protein [Pseudomonadota bacterium]
MFLIIKKSSLFTCLLVITIFIVYGCSSNARAPVEQRVNNKSFYEKNKKGFNKNKKHSYYYIRKGDSLYSIAWEYGLDFKDLAKWNNLKNPYLIFAGQRLNLKAKKTKGYAKTSRKNNIKPQKKLKVKRKYKKNNYKKSNNKKIVIAKKQSQQQYKKKLYWIWPAKGKLIQRFAPSKRKKGIDISLPNRKPIKAAESGKVVYSGHGLRGYGLLIIIKHNNQYLSAYAHNSKLLVNEGSKVKRNQTIALAGKTASDRVKLHFEIRKNGKPVNPLKYLPK